jgi:hypothetical protein
MQITLFSAANDNALRDGTRLARNLVLQPLDHTTVWLAFTGCEEVGDLGMGAFLDAHEDELGNEQSTLSWTKWDWALEYLRRMAYSSNTPTRLP